MPNIATVLKEEIVRLARKELRRELESLRKASALYRSEIAALKRRAGSLEKLVSRLERRAAAPGEAGKAKAGAGIRFRSKGLASHRERLGLSAQQAGLLLGVSAQTVYSWESGRTRPRASQLAAIAALRQLGKRQAAALLKDRAD